MSAQWGLLTARGLLTLVIGLVAQSTQAAQKAEDQPPAIRYAGQIEETTDMARRLREVTGVLEGDFGRYGGFVRGDLSKHKEACEAAAVIYEKICQAYKAGDVDEVHRLREEAAKADKDRAVWRYRITELRMKQALAAPSEQWYVSETRWLPEALAPDLFAVEQARKNAAEAWGRAAESLFPGCEMDAHEKLKEDAYTAEGEREIATWRFEWATQRDRLMSDKTVKSQAMLDAMEQLKKAQEKRVELKRGEVERERRGREVEKQVRAAEKAFREAYDAAVKVKKKP